MKSASYKFNTNFSSNQKWHNKQKYNNARRSIPTHPTFVNDTHRDLHLWTVTPKSIGFTVVYMSAKFNDEAHNS